MVILSEFNILEYNGRMILIDWPQALKKNEANASELLEARQKPTY
ncbi:hypothetical protein FHEFKHOI_01907 [Candidatus Methanoperedenaceae archaeon GB50]|nr:hypothetical protein FHEFKHOI_01907 [Candidatus Methanoperedenaceae archaeon GB50]